MASVLTNLQDSAALEAVTTTVQRQTLHAKSRVSVPVQGQASAPFEPAMPTGWYAYPYAICTLHPKWSSL